MSSPYLLILLVAFVNLPQNSRKFHSMSKRRSACVPMNLESLQSGFTCDTSVAITCPSTKKIVVLDVVYSSECPRLSGEENGTSIYAPSRCIGFDRERASSQCNGQSTCTVGNTLEQRPSFLIGKQANCAFKGQSLNVEYSCVPGKASKPFLVDRNGSFQISTPANCLGSISVHSNRSTNSKKVLFTRPITPLSTPAVSTVPKWHLRLVLVTGKCCRPTLH